ncbi:GL14527 [Drosophila persimilis]|uniref:GL14527 n=1 Tax=Drosophila persimilis TaxID=7234 RepID=B4GW66_DROPE|nr:GL14527 [Drosophila persimilis]
MKTGGGGPYRASRVCPAASSSTSGASAHPGTQLSEFQSPTSPNPSETGTATTAELRAEPVYDNLGLRTTAGGNSTLNLHKALGAQGAQQQYSMRDRPLPATPSLTSVASAANVSKIYEPIHELIHAAAAAATAATATAPLSLRNRVSHFGSMGSMGQLRARRKIGKDIHQDHHRSPKKKMSVTTTRSGQGSTSQLFDDEGEDGTEV